MSRYTTGEMAKLCNVSVRTVQYYDTRGLLIPSELSEGGRRLYSDDDLNKLKIICFLRGIGLSIDDIGKFFAESNSKEVIALLLSQQESLLQTEIAEREQKLHTLIEIKNALKDCTSISPQTIGDIAFIMEQKQKLHRLRGFMISVGIVADVIEVGTLIWWIKTGIWWPFAVGMIFAVLISYATVKIAYDRLVYICPDCHEVFQPRFKSFFFAAHTLNTRKLTCPKCNHTSYCVETCKTEK